MFAMISQNDLYDMSFALVLIRNNIQYDLNSVVVSKIEQVLKNNSLQFEDNQFRKALATIDNLDYTKWYYVLHNNIYVNHRLLADYDVYRLLIQLCNTLKELLYQQHFEQAYDLVDCFHCLPNIIADHNLTIPKYYWKTYIKAYRNKWNRAFLKDEEKQFKKAKSHNTGDDS